MFHNQPKRTKFRVGDIVHLIDSPIQPKAGDDRARSGLATSGGLQRHQRSTQKSKSRADGGVESSANISRSTVYKVTALNESRTDKRQHQYELTPLEPLKITTTEANMIPALFLPGDIVTPLNSAASSENYYRVKAITIEEDAALLTSRIGYGATPGLPVKDDGEYEVLEKPVAGSLPKSQQQEVGGASLEGVKKTSLGKGKPEERLRVVLRLVNGSGVEQTMDASMVKKVPRDEEWNFAELEKFMGQE